MPVDVIEAHIASALDLIVQTARSTDGSRFVAEIAAVSFDRKRRECVTRTLFKREPHERRGAWSCAPAWLDGLPKAGLATEGQVIAWKQASCCAA